MPIAYIIEVERQRTQKELGLTPQYDISPKQIFRLIGKVIKGRRLMSEFAGIIYYS